MLSVYLALLLMPLQHLVSAQFSPAWRIRNGVPPPSSGHWAVYAVRLYANSHYDIELRRWICKDPITVTGTNSIISSGEDVGSSSPDVLFHGVIDDTRYWRSQHHTGAGDAWFGVEFHQSSQVQCIQVYQADSLGSPSNLSYRAQQIVLERRKTGTGENGIPAEWIHHGEWGGPSSGKLHGYSWLTLPVGIAAHPAYGSCPTAEAEVQAFGECCVWPHIGWRDMRLASGTLVAFAPASEDSAPAAEASEDPCTPGATVPKGTACEVVFNDCDVHAEMRCIGGQVVVDVEESADSESPSLHACIQEGKDFMIAGASPLGEVDYHTPAPRTADSEGKGSNGLIVILGLTAVMLCCVSPMVACCYFMRRGKNHSWEEFKDTSADSLPIRLGKKESDTTAVSLHASHDSKSQESEFPMEIQLQPRASATNSTSITKDKSRLATAPTEERMTSGATAAENVRKTVQSALALPSWRTKAEGAQQEEVMRECSP